jgi:hypothetical protein
MPDEEIKMKKLIFVAAALLLSIPALARGSHGGGHSGGHSGGSHAGAHVSHSSKAATGTGAKAQREHVAAYTKKDGTRVAGHDRSTKDSTTKNNWSKKGNVNPETGKAGTK